MATTQVKTLVNPYPRTALAFCLLLFAGLSFASKMMSLDDFRWENRLILVKGFSPEQIDTAIKQFEENRSRIDERQIIWFILDENASTLRMHSNSTGDEHLSLASDIHARFRNRTAKNVILIGKDGGTKSVSKVLTLPALFQTIDAMPMRMREMSEQRRRENFSNP